MSFPLLVTLHVLAATVWTSGHLVLALGVLPRALRQGDARVIRAYEEPFEPLGLTALALLVTTGLAMGWIHLPGFAELFTSTTPITSLISLELLVLAVTVALALHARLRLIPNLRDDDLTPLAWHIGAITLLAVAFVVAGAGIRLGGFP